jgi:succinyldiaminopimelate transaminase
VSLRPNRLPDFPWDTLNPYRERASKHPDGAVVLAIGTPVDSTPPSIQEALAATSDSPGYPTTHGSPALREAVAAWFSRRRGVPNISPEAVLPTLGSKELVGWLPTLLGIGEGDVVVLPRVAYPTYEVGATLVGAKIIATDDVDIWSRRSDVRLVWVNSPSNPTGEVVSKDALAKVVAAARDIGAVVASDECYAEFPWREPWSSEGVPSILDPGVCGGSHDNVLAAYSLSKRSNLAGYRAAFVAGDPAIVARLLDARKHLGMIMPGPVQAAMAVALGDDSHVEVQRARYGRRRAILLAAFESVGFTVAESDAGLYLWATRDEDCWLTVGWLADQGIVVAPGAFYGSDGAAFVRIALTATDERVEAAARRLSRLR